MPTGLKFWQIQENKPEPVDPDKLDFESRLEKWLQEDISLVSDDLLVIGKQVPTESGGKIDLLAVDSDANVVVLELKRSRTPRDVVAQTLDYASWVHRLDYEDVMEPSVESSGRLEGLRGCIQGEIRRRPSGKSSTCDIGCTLSRRLSTRLPRESSSISPKSMGWT